jgi:hypothetical protein
VTIATGIIVLAQESRFRLVDAKGRAELFLLAHDAGIEPADLQDLQRRHARVAVRFSQAPHLVAKVAHALYAASDRPGD